MSGADKSATQPRRRSFNRDENAGIIIAIGPTLAVVQPNGGSSNRKCLHDLGAGAWVGKRCTYKWIPGRKAYVIQSVVGVPATLNSQDSDPASFELAPPSNLQSSSAIGGAVLLIWDSPPQQDITVEVLFNTSQTEAGASIWRTRGGQCLIPAGSTIYFKIRSVTENWRRSSWSNWGSDDPGTGTPAPDSNAIHVNVANEISGITEKGTPVSADLLVIEDSEASGNKKKVQVGNLPGGSGTDANAVHVNQAGEISAITAKATPTSSDFLLIEDAAASDAKKRITIGDLPDDPTAVHTDVSNEISGLTEKGTPVSGDLLVIEDSAASGVKKKIQIGNLPGGSGTDADAVHDNVANEIHAITEKYDPNAHDVLLIESYDDSWAKRFIQIQNMQVLHTDSYILSEIAAQTDEPDPADDYYYLVEKDDGYKRKVSHLNLQKHNIQDNVAGQIAAIAEKTDPVVDDLVIIEDSEIGNVKRRMKLSALAAIASGGVINLTMRVVVSTGAVTITTADYVVVINKTASETTAVTLPGSPTTGDSYVVKDGKGNAASYNITVSPAAGNIDGAGSYVISQNYGSASFVYNGTEWNVF